MIRGIALVVDAESIAFDCAFQILACPADRKMVGITFTAPREVHRARIGQYVVVRFSPDDQFAYECKEALDE